MEEIEVTFGRAAAIWWAWTWRTMLATILVALLLGMALGLAERTFLPSQWLLAHAASLPVLGRAFTGFVLLINILISIRIFKGILKRRFHGYRIVLVKYQDYYTEPF